MHIWNVRHAARWKYRTQKWRKNSPSGHHRTTLSGYIFATKAYIDNRKKPLKQSDMSSICPHNMVNFGLLTAEICWRVWGTPANFNGFRVLGATARHLVVGVSQTLRRWTEGATYVRHGDHYVGHWHTFLVLWCYTHALGHMNLCGKTDVTDITFVFAFTTVTSVSKRTPKLPTS